MQNRLLRALRRSWAVPAALGLLAAGCSDGDEGTGPDPEPVGPPEIEAFLVEDPSITHGEYTRLRWRIKNSDVAVVTHDLAAMPGIGQVDHPENGSAVIRPHGNVSFHLVATNDFGSVEADVAMEVRFPAAFYVKSNGADTNPGDRPDVALRTLAEALNRTQGGGAIFVAIGDYTDSLVIDGVARSVYGSLDPVTFFEHGGTNRTTLRPAGNTPLHVRNTGASTVFLSALDFDARNGGAFGGEIENAVVVVDGCVIDSGDFGPAIGLSIHGTSNVRITASLIRGGRAAMGATHTRTVGIEVDGPSSLLATNCFIDGGYGILSSYGVDTGATGSVRLGLNTISAKALGGGGEAASVRIRGGSPAIGGNILFTRGGTKRLAVVEAAPDADPSHFEGNLVVGLSAGLSPYRNDPGDLALGELGDPILEDQLNDIRYVNFSGGGSPKTTIVNKLINGVAVADLFVAPDRGEYHLRPLLPDLSRNPAIDAGDYNLVTDRYGPEFDDIDGDRRPSVPTLYDLGADEH